MCKIINLDIGRVLFIFRNNRYLRLRLNKIQANIFHYTKTDNDNPSQLTQEEAEFALNYKENVTEHFQSLALRHIPGVWESEKVFPSVPAPNLSTAVFVSVKEDVPGVDIKDEAGLGRDDTVDFLKGSQHIVKYDVVSHLVDEGSVQLI